MPQHIDVEELLKALDARLPQAPKGITQEDLSTALAAQKTELLSAVSEEVRKAIPAPDLTRNPGTGSKANIDPDPRESDPLNYILKKCQSGEELSPEDKALVWGLTKEYLAIGLKDEK
jgi:hypothetical protein